MKSEDLINDLIERTKDNLNRIEKLNTFDHQQLNTKTAPDCWSALECIEHLNRYGEFYIPEIQRRIKNSRYNFHPAFKSGWLGDYFAKSLAPKETVNKMKTFKSMNPVGSTLTKEVLDIFMKQQHELLRLLIRSRNINLQKTKTSISIVKGLKLKLGDTFRVVIYHNQRHLDQAERVLNELDKTKK